MTSSEPHGISRRSVLRGAAIVGAAAAMPQLLTSTPAHAVDDNTGGSYTVAFDDNAAKRQTILGLGFEIQSDSIGSNDGPTDDGLVSGVPLDLTAAAYTRFVNDLLKAGRSDRGFRYCRLAMGLYHRGVTADGKRFQDRYPDQTKKLATMVQDAGIEGLGVEYWSPAPHWKSNGQLGGGPNKDATLASFAPAEAAAMGDAMVADLDYLVENSRETPSSPPRLKIIWWSLQNEPNQGASYSSCKYTDEQYRDVFNIIAPKIRADYPDTKIHATSISGWWNNRGAVLKNNATSMQYIDAWTWHKIGADSNTQITENYTGSGVDFRPVFNNEFEYLGGHGPVVDRDTLNTAQSIMNWMTFQNAPTWWWLHALKPSTDALSENYGLGTWRPPGAPADSRFPGLQPGDWTFNPRNWNAVAGFVRFMPWDSVRYNVEEPHPTEANGGLKTHPNGITTPGSVTYRPDQRIMAWKTPGGKPVLVVTNRGNANYTFTVDTRTTGTFRGYRYGPSTNMAGVGAKSGTTLTLTVPPLSIEFWVHD
ncbi:glycoside hydrolase family 30 beta sandwich domain-containing protein [Kitasatospora purpeofusca]|uniref:glycoside hydrolase family 30 beta sandwich domain-containing protein n=1 Tax=Kitasatospora purpeofusca TaxID=67352 RepID=UPI0036AB2B33